MQRGIIDAVSRVVSLLHLPLTQMSAAGAKREMFVNEILMASLATIQCLPPELARAEKRWLGSDSRETHQGFTDLNLVTRSTLSVSFFDPLRFSKVLVIHSTFFALFKMLFSLISSGHWILVGMKSKPGCN